MGRLTLRLGSGLLWLLPGLPGLLAASSGLPKLRARARPRRADASASEAWAVEGDCVLEGQCVTSPGYPGAYENDDHCTLSVLQQPSVVRIVDFTTESRYDTLMIEGRPYNGGSEGKVGRSITVWSTITWTTDGSDVSTGWRLCVEEPSSCDDGLPLSPVPVSQCPPVTEALASCELAQPGELCEGDGACGTRTDINNCYDQQYSYPASRDVYRKGTGTTRTVTTTSSSMTSVTSTTETATFNSATEGQPSWTVLGDCQIFGGLCVRSTDYPREYPGGEECTMSVPIPSVVKVKAFDTEKGYDFLTVNGVSYSGSSLESRTLVVWSNITWFSDDSVAGSGWELCMEPLPSCADGLLLTPVAVRDCPDPAEELPDCQEAAPGQLCDAGSCGTRNDIDNCYDSLYSHPPSRDVYRKEAGTTRTMTLTTTSQKSQTTFTATRPLGAGYYPGPAPWVVEGSCGTFGACAESPHFPQPYGDDESCALSLPQPSVIRVTFFSTEDSFDALQVNGHVYSGRVLAGESLVVWSNITWSSDSSVVDLGWQLCVDAPPYCSDGLGLVPVPVSECPPPSEELPTCHAASPGELCDGHGDCGTRKAARPPASNPPCVNPMQFFLSCQVVLTTRILHGNGSYACGGKDINNCYDSSYTYPASRDVYRKVSGSTSTTGTVTTTSKTTQSTTTTMSVACSLRSNGLFLVSSIRRIPAVTADILASCLGPRSPRSRASGMDRRRGLCTAPASCTAAALRAPTSRCRTPRTRHAHWRCRSPPWFRQPLSKITAPQVLAVFSLICRTLTYWASTVFVISGSKIKLLGGPQKLNIVVLWLTTSTDRPRAHEPRRHQDDATYDTASRGNGYPERGTHLKSFLVRVAV